MDQIFCHNFNLIFPHLRRELLTERADLDCCCDEEETAGESSCETRPPLGPRPPQNKSSSSFNQCGGSLSYKFCSKITR